MEFENSEKSGFLADKSGNIKPGTSGSSCESTTIKTGAGHLEPIAIVGLAFEFPQGVSNEEALWAMLMEKRCAMTKIPPDRLNVDAFYHPDANRLDSLSFTGGHFLTQSISAFDASFFSLTPGEAAALDPQQRILLETTYHALENAGISMADIAGTKTSVHTGCFSNDYAILCSRDSQVPSKYAAIGLAQTMLANRISWFFDLQGPSVNLDSACSSSMMALDLGCQALWSGETTMGIVAGCNLIFNFDGLACLDNMGFLSCDSRCFSFDHRANGYARGEGFGVLILKRLNDAVQNNDTIRAIIRATGSNQDGRTPNVSQPSKTSQESLIRDTYTKAGLSMDKTAYFESHGTGTAVGDPIEAGAVASAFRRQDTGEPLYIGAIKSNIGHLEGASGVAGLIKTVIALEKGIIPPNTNFEELNVRVDAGFLKLKFPSEPIPWPRDGVRRASVSSFGFGGSNSHAVLEDAYHHLQAYGLSANHSTVVASSHTRSIGVNGIINGNLNIHSAGEDAWGRSQLLVFSAASEDTLEALLAEYSRHMSRTSLTADQLSDYLQNLAFTLGARRSHLPCRAFAIVEPETAERGLMSLLHRSSNVKGNKTSLGLVFSGQGAQWHAMGRELLAYPAFRASLEEAEKYFLSLGSQWLLLDEFLKSKDVSCVSQARLSQPMCTALQVALCDLLKALKISPQVVVGHSSGEIASAYCAGAISRMYAWKLAYYRGLLASTLETSVCTSGSMLACALSAEEAQRHIDALKQRFPNSSIEVACINSPFNVTVSGDVDQIDVLKCTLQEHSVFTRKLMVSVAYHSTHMDRISNAYSDCIGDDPIEREEDRMAPTMLSSVTLSWVTAKQLAQRGYWVSNLVSPVRFSDAISQIFSYTTCDTTKKIDLSHRYALSLDHLLEIGPHSALQAPIRETLEALDLPKKISYNSILSRNKSAMETMLCALGELYCQGHNINLNVANRLAQLAKPPKVLTNLPSYPFDHSHSYWFESRISKELRFRRHPRSDLLGIPVSDWNPLEARWRHIWKLSDQPWLEEHKINGAILYPGAGMVIMAVEAACQLADPSRPIKGFTITDATFQSPLHIPATADGIETHFTLRATSQDSKSHSSSEFQLCAFDGEHWHNNCHGSIRIHYGDPDEIPSEGSEANPQKVGYQTWFSGSTEIDRDLMYRRMDECGFNYGTLFKPITAIRYYPENKAFSDVDTSGPGIGSESQRYVIHPTTLDGILQLSFTALTKGCTTDLPTTIPTRIRRLWISNTGLRAPRTNQLHVFCESRFWGPRGTESSIYASDQEFRLRLALEGLETTLVADKASRSNEVEEEPLLLYNMEWKPDLDLLRPAQILDYCGIGVGESPTEFFHELTIILLFFSRKALSLISDSSLNISAYPPSLQTYLAWMNWQVTHTAQSIASIELNTLLEQAPQKIDEMCNRLENSGGQGKAFVAVGKMLPKILSNELNPLECLLGSELLKGYYHDVFNTVKCIPNLKRYLEALVHKSPNMKFLEVGAGTGGMTKHILDVLDSDEPGPFRCQKFTRYDYTDISPTFFELAREVFAPWSNHMSFRTLDIEKDAVEQGFEKESYDVLIASSVLHATKDLDGTVSNLRALLKPGGKLIIFEVTNPQILRVGFIFGLLPSWWQGVWKLFTLNTHVSHIDSGVEEQRLLSPCVTTSDWQTILIRNGFETAQLVFPDYGDISCQEMSIIVATAKYPNHHLERRLMPRYMRLIVFSDGSISQQRIAESIKHYAAEALRTDCTLMAIDQEASVPLSGSFCIVLNDFGTDFLRGMNEERFTTLKKVLLEPARVLWVCSDGGSFSRNPFYGIIDGLSRSVSTENGRVQVVKLAIDPAGSRLEDCAGSIFQVLNHAISRKPDELEPEFLQRHNMIHINRMVIDGRASQTVSKSKAVKHAEENYFGDGSPLKLSVASLGLLDSLVFVHDADFSKPLDPEEVEIEVKAFGINFKDCLVALGQVNQDALGCECAGVITRTGEGSGFMPGDRVMACTLNTMRTYARTSMHNAVKIPDDMPFEEAAALPTNFVTAWYSLYEVAQLRAGESILIHSGAGGTGQAAIQIAQHLGAQVYSTTSSNEKRALITRLYGIPDSHIFNSGDVSFADNVRKQTKGRGVDVVLNSLSGDALLSSWECMAPYGRFLELGLKDITGHGKLPMFPFAKNVSFRAIDVASITVEQPRIIRRTWLALMPLIESGQVKAAQPLQTSGLNGIENAFREMQSGRNSGKMVVSVETECRVKTMIDATYRPKFSGDATYVIGGGLGGLGRSIVRWMVRRGAKHFILLSRFGPRTESAISFVREIGDMGIDVKTPACDISDLDAVQHCIATCGSTMPPIKGCIQSAMVLKDALFQNMTFEDWKTSTESKIAGSWNLHSSCPHGMDFFILLSSITGVVGSPGQANYCAGNTFMDALARHRVSNGEKAISIDLGVMDGAGFLAENPEFLKKWIGPGHMVRIAQDQLFSMLERYCDPSLGILASEQCQIALGIELPAKLSGRQIEPAAWLSKPLFRHLYQIGASERLNTSTTASRDDVTSRFVSAQTLTDAVGVVVKAFATKLSKTLSIPEESIDISCSPLAYGVDSLVAVELRNWFSKYFAADIPIFDILGGEKFSTISEIVAQTSSLREERPNHI